MKKIFFMVTILCATFVLSNAQTNYLVVGTDIRLPKDSIMSSQLITCLNNFLLIAQKNNAENNWVLPSEKAETKILLDEISGMEKADDINFKPYLTNVEMLGDKKSYLITVAYMGLNDTHPLLRASFEFIAHRTTDGFLFSSPLLRCTKDWNVKTVGHFVFHYQETTAENSINEHVKYLVEFDKMLNLDKKTEYYFCDDCESMSQMLRLAGVLYKLDYNSFTWSGMSYVTNEKVILLQTQQQSRLKEVDPHYIFHARAELAVPSEKSNYYMICAGANVYSSCWGMSWSEIQKLFKSRMTYDKKTDWLKLYYERYNFGESKQKYLYVTTFINGLIIQKIEKEQGFAVVKELFASGNMFKERELFFKNLEKVAGINEKNFNKEVGKLINEAMKDK